MKNNQLVSVCVPVFNGGLYLKETLNSLVMQTYQNIEIIVSDNASTDDTGEIVKSFCVKDPRVKFFRNETNIGYCGNIMAAVNRAQAAFVAIYHADDIYDPKIVEKQVEVLIKDESIAGVFVKMYQFYPGKKLVKPNIYSNLISSSLLNQEVNIISGIYPDFLPWIMKLGNFFVCPSFMTRKEIYLKTGGYNDTYPSNEDLHLWVRYLQSGYKLAIINEFLIKYRICEDNASASWRKSVELSAMYNVIDDLIISKDDVLDKEILKFYYKNKSKSYLYAGYNAYLQDNIEKIHENLKKSISTYSYPFFSKYGLSQRFFNISCYVKSKMFNY